MKSQLIAIVAAVLVVGCGESQPPEPPTAKATDISIHKAARDGNIEAVKQHLAAGTDVNAKGNYGLTPLYWAAQSGYKEVAELLIAKGADVNAKSSEGTTPLHRATYYSDHKEIAELLISKGADVNAKDDGGKTPLDWAYGEAADLIRKHGGKTGAELKAAEPVAEASKPEPPTAKATDISIHKAGTDVNAKDEDGWTPLLVAAFNGRKEIAELLIAKGANVNATDEVGRTPLHHTAIQGYKEISELLIDNGADVNAKDEDGWSVLDMALASKNEEIITFIKTSGGHSNAGKSIFVASGIGDLEAVKKHLVTGMDVNAKSESGWTPLHYAGDQINVCEFLLSKDAQVNAVNNAGETPLDNAIFWKDSATTALLRKHGGKTGEELKAEGAK
jgi:ankyrin repeat protein